MSSPDIQKRHRYLKQSKVLPREDPGAEEIVYLDVGSVEWTMVQTNVDGRAYELEESICTTSTVTHRWFSTPMSAGEKENSMSEVRVVGLTKKVGRFVAVDDNRALYSTVASRVTNLSMSSALFIRKTLSKILSRTPR